MLEERACEGDDEDTQFSRRVCPCYLSSVSLIDNSSRFGAVIKYAFQDFLSMSLYVTLSLKCALTHSEIDWYQAHSHPPTNVKL